MSILTLRDENGNVHEILALRGEKGEKGDPSVDVLNVTIDGGKASHTPSQIKSFADAGGLVILESSYFLSDVSQYTAYFSKETIGANQVCVDSYTIDQDGSVNHSDYTQPIVEIDQGLERSGCAADAKAVGDRLAELSVGTGGGMADVPTDEKYFDITADGMISLKDVYRGAIPSTKYGYAISDKGQGVAGSENNKLPEIIVIPEKVNGIEVTSVPIGMLAYNNAVKKIILNSNIVELPQIFARDAHNLCEVKGTENVKILGKQAFYATKIESINLPKLEDVSTAESAFQYCDSLAYANIGSKITQIPAKMFSTCVNLANVDGGEKVTVVNNDAFYRTFSLGSLSFLKNLTSIGTNAFRNSGIDYDWASLGLSSDAYGSCATVLQYNTTDFWTAPTKIKSDVELCSTFAQNDPDWANEILFQSGSTNYYWGANGCVPTSAAMVYSALEGKYLATPKDFVEAVKAVNASLVSKSPRELINIKSWFEALGYTVERAWLSWTAFQNIYKYLASGSLVLMTVDEEGYNSDGTVKDFGEGHVAVICGADGEGKVYVQDPKGYGEKTGDYNSPTFVMPLQSIAKPGKEFLVVTKNFTNGDFVVKGTDNVKRKIVFNADGLCSWTDGVTPAAGIDTIVQAVIAALPSAEGVGF